MKPGQLWRGSWSALQDCMKVLSRVLGLGVILAGLKSLRRLTIGKGYDEPTKIAIRRSRTTALLRALIHVAPLSVALWEIVLNWNTYYVGATIRNIAYYQFGAKVHEMAAQASLAAIIFTYIRHELSLGQGLPFGALFSGLQISQISYLWSMEFWGTACSKNLPIRKKIGIIGIISIAIFLAATIGPSSAILLIPRLAYWPAGSTDIWVNATFQDLWPDRTNGSLVSTSCLTWDSVTYDVDCPAGDWQAIQKSLYLTSGSIPRAQEIYSGIPIPAEVEVTGKSSLRQISTVEGIIAGKTVGSQPSVVFNAYVASSQQLAVADALTTTGILWNVAMANISTKGHGSVLSQLDAVHSITTGYYQPYSSVVCEYDVIRGPTDTDLVTFPAFSGLGVQADTAFSQNSTLLDDRLVFQNLTKADILNTTGGISEYRLRWVELPFNGTAIGAVIVTPRPPKNTTQDILVCSIGAGWGSSTMNTSTVAGSAGPVLSQVDTQAVGKLLRNHNQTDGPAWYQSYSEAEELSTIREGFFYSPIFPERSVTVTEDWATFLNPSIDHLNTTVFNNLMRVDTGMHLSNQAGLILAEMMANGLARIGSTSQLQGTVRQVTEPDQSIGLDGNYWFAGKGNNVFQVDPGESQDWVKFRVSTTVNGYAYNTHGTTIRLAISLLVTYCLVAIAHTIYAGISGISSTCWDSIAEVTALAINSAPTAALRNTCAGITELNIFKLPVRILAFRDTEGDGEHLELVFGNLDEKVLDNKTIKANRVYGTMFTIKAHEKTA